MLYLNDDNIRTLQSSWNAAVDVIEDAIYIWAHGNFSQPLKPYLRFGDPRNRIIAMPAFLGESCHTAGIKWIASFPSNINYNLPRAHSVTLLNDADTGKPLALINSPTISGIRTAAVSGAVIRQFLLGFPTRKIKVGMIGLGPIGQLHLHMITELLGVSLDTILIYDKIPAVRSKAPSYHPKAQAVDTWTKAYQDADIFITCTTGSEPYINQLPKPGSLHLNVSLRDYSSEILKKCSHIIVDDWDEVCRENTDIERAHNQYGLQREDTLSLKTIVGERYFTTIDRQKFMHEEFCLFNPMGMALFDIAIAKYYFNQATARNQGLELPS